MTVVALVTSLTNKKEEDGRLFGDPVFLRGHLISYHRLSPAASTSASVSRWARGRLDEARSSAGNGGSFFSGQTEGVPHQRRVASPSSPYQLGFHQPRAVIQRRKREPVPDSKVC